MRRAHFLPRSIPDYQWPERLLSWRYAPLRWIGAATFYVAYIAGLIASIVLRMGRDRVLVIRTDGLGDALLFEPALENLAQSLSPRRIHLWAPRLTCELFRHVPSVHRLREIPRGFKQGNLAYLRSLRWRAAIGAELGFWKFDKAIYPAESPEPLGNWLMASARTVDRWVNAGDTINQFDWQQERAQRLATKVIENRPGSAHELTRNEYLAEQWSGHRTLRRPKVYLTEAYTSSAERELATWRAAARTAGGNELVGVIPAASISVNAYPQAQWVATLKRLWQEQRAIPVLLGGLADETTLAALAEALHNSDVPVMRSSRRFDILEQAAVIDQLDATIGVDTGLSHLAVAQQTPSVVLVAGGNPGRFFPWPGVAQHAALNVSMPCEGCNNRCTLAEPECITRISPDEIVAAYLRVMGRRVPLEVYVASRAGNLQAAG